MSTRTVLIYDDLGVDYQSPQGFIEGFEEILDPSIKVERVTAQTLRTPGWEKTTRALVFGAGTASIWDESLGPEGRENIRNYVTEYGGTYIGACSGAMFVAEQSQFGSMIKKRGIDFFPGKTIGPLKDVENYRDPAAASAEKVTFTFENSVLSGHLYTQGGCYFEPSLFNAENVQVVATYSDSKPAAVFCKVGKGRAFLMGPHVEFSPRPLQYVSDPRIEKLARILYAQESFRRTVFKGIATILRLR
jgi:biotin--protein ligase